MNVLNQQANGAYCARCGVQLPRLSRVLVCKDCLTILSVRYELADADQMEQALLRQFASMSDEQLAAAGVPRLRSAISLACKHARPDVAKRIEDIVWKLEFDPNANTKRTALLIGIAFVVVLLYMSYFR